VRTAARFRLALLAALGLAVISGCSLATGSSPTSATDAPVQHNDSLPGTDVTQAGDGSGDLREVEFHSKALGRMDSYLIYLPPGYQSTVRSGGRFSVLYMLHGDGNHGDRSASHLFESGRVGEAATDLYASGQLKPMLIVVPNLAGQNSDGDTEWANTGRGRYESALVQMVHEVDSTWPTIANRSGRGISGLSMGGYGAVNVGLRHLNLFSTIESWSGYFNQTRTGPYVGASRKLLRATSPAVYVQRIRRALARHPIAVLLYVSPNEAFEDEQAPFAKTLRSLSVPVKTRLFEGHHDFDLWSAHMALALEFADSHLADPRSG
jgi:enterochelin esterase-like enzyme